jgi:hypothetical protein
MVIPGSPKLACSIDGTKILAGGFEGPSKYSRDAGMSWIDGAGGSWNLAVACSADGTQLAVSTYSLRYGVWSWIWVSYNSGASWTKTLPDSCWELVCSSDMTRLAAVNGSGNILVSTDSGVSWHSAGKNGSQLTLTPDGSRLMANSGGSLVLSTNFGDTWTVISSNPPPISSMACSADGSMIITAPASGNVAISSYSGTAWIDTHLASQNWHSVACSADGRRLIAADGQHIYLGVMPGTPVPPLITSVRAGATQVTVTVAVPRWAHFVRLESMTNAPTGTWQLESVQNVTLPSATFVVDKLGPAKWLRARCDEM